MENKSRMDRAVRSSVAKWVLAGICVLVLSCALGCLSETAQNDGNIESVVQVTLAPTPTPAPTPVPTPTPTPEPTPAPTPSGLCGGRYDVFTDGEVIQTETAYRTKDVAVFFSEVSEDLSDITGKKLIYYVADIYVQNIEDLRSGVTHEKKSMERMTRREGAAVAISGDFAAYRKVGISIRNGEVFRAKVDKKRDTAVLYRDGSFVTFEKDTYDAKEIVASDPWNVWTFGPALLDENGRRKEEFNTDVFARNPRAALGYYEPGHYCLVVVRGRIKASAGLDMAELSLLMERLGCKSAFNLDGGVTAQIFWNGEVYHAGKASRMLNDIVYVSLAPTDSEQT